MSAGGVLARRDAARETATAAAVARHAAAATARDALAAASVAKGTAKADRCKAAHELHAVLLQRRARAGITKVQRAAFESRRASAAEAKAAKAMEAAALNEAAATRRAELLAKRTAVAKALSAPGPLNKPKAAEALARADRPVMVAFTG